MSDQTLPARREAPTEHYTILVKALVEGRVVPFLGAGVHLFSRPSTMQWRFGSTYLPN
jgi:hypothetical protein